MLFYNIQKHCYVVIEIKTRAFEPGDMGQLGTYIAATDGILRGENGVNADHIIEIALDSIENEEFL